ncbi:hypothetical protein [Micromonospora sp. URMC 103]|uniref:hypothetical protein n=1 Tax=Micromonospora sp. URMC 103 TaxID=3423406 RepID=UPI003F1A549B
MTARVLPHWVTVGAALDRLALLDLKRRLLRLEGHRRTAVDEHGRLRAAWLAAGLPPPETTAPYPLLSSVHRTLWRLENAVRDAERRRAFGPEFVALFARIQRSNADRAGHRRLADAALAAGGGAGLLEVPAGLDTYADQIAIDEVRHGRDPAHPLTLAKVLRDVWLSDGLPDLFDGADYRRLRLANDRLWSVKDDLDAGLAGSGPAVATCRSLYLVNDARSRVKRRIAVALGSALRDVKEYAAYPLPASWDPARLDWRVG